MVASDEGKDCFSKVREALTSDFEEWMYNDKQLKALKKQELHRPKLVKPARKLDLEALPSLNRNSLTLPVELKLEIVELIGTDKDIVNLAHFMLISKDWYVAISEDSFWEKLAEKIGVKRRPRGKTWKDAYIAHYTTHCLGCSAHCLNSSDDYPYFALEPATAKVCFVCSRKTKYKTIGMSTALKDYKVNQADLARLYSVKSYINYRDHYEFRKADVTQIHATFKKNEESKRNTLARLLEEGEKREAFLLAFRRSRVKNPLYPESLLPNMGNSLIQMFDAEVDSEVLCKEMKAMVNFGEKLGNLDSDIRKALSTEPHASRITYYATGRLTKHSFSKEKIAHYNLIAKGRLSLPTFLEAIKAEFKCRQEIKEAHDS